MVILQKKVGNQWVDIADTSELVDGDIYRQSVGGKINPQGDLVGNGWEQKTYITPQEIAATKFVNMSKLGELLSDTILIELENMKSGGQASTRAISLRTLTRIHSNALVNVLVDEFQQFIDSLVAETSLTEELASDIIAKLQAP